MNDKPEQSSASVQRSEFSAHRSDPPSSVAPVVAAARALVIIGYPWWLRPFLARDVIAITLGRRIYLRRAPEGEAGQRLLRHELAHVRQVHELGVLVFLWRYVLEFARNWVRLRNLAAAYSAISFEIEARGAEEGDSGTAYNSEV